MKIVPASEENIRLAADLIADGDIVACPTETVYGLSADPFSEPALARLRKLKGREADQPVLLLVADVGQLASVVEYVPEEAMPFMLRFWPGPLTLLFPRASCLPSVLTAGAPKVAIRCPACEIARSLCRACGHPITSTSANLTGEEPATSAESITTNVALILNGGPRTQQPPSTVFDPVSGELLRTGSISRQMLDAVTARTHE